MRLQFFARAEVMKAPVNNREIIFRYFFLLAFLILTGRKKFLVPSNLRSHETRQDLDPRKVTEAVVA